LGDLAKVTDQDKSSDRALTHNMRAWQRVNGCVEHYFQEPMSDEDMELENKDFVIPCCVRELSYDFQSLLNTFEEETLARRRAFRMLDD